MFDERARVLAIVASTSRPWHEVAGLLEAAGSASRVLDGDLPDDLDDAERAIAAHAAQTVTSADIEQYCPLIGAMEQEGARLVTVLDSDYPALLREIYNRPPFLFVRGELSQADEFAVSVVGTRRASPEGIDTPCATW